MDRDPKLAPFLATDVHLKPSDSLMDHECGIVETEKRLAIEASSPRTQFAAQQFFIMGRSWQNKSQESATVGVRAQEYVLAPFSLGIAVEIHCKSQLWLRDFKMD